MGSGASKSDTNGVALPARFRPVFLQRIEEFTARRHSRPLKDPIALSKKELLEQESVASSLHRHNDVNKTTPTSHVNAVSPSNKHEGPKLYEAPHMKNESLEAKERAHDEDTEEDVFKDFDDVDDDSDDENDERMIGKRDSDAFPGSPSFRVYFNDNGDGNVTGKVDDIRSKAPHDDATASEPEDSSVSSNQVKGRAKKKRSFKNVFPKSGQAAMKNLLNVTSCYTPSHSSHHERNRLLTDKPAN